MKNGEIRSAEDLKIHANQVSGNDGEEEPEDAVFLLPEAEKKDDDQHAAKENIGRAHGGMGNHRLSVNDKMTAGIIEETKDFQEVRHKNEGSDNFHQDDPAKELSVNEEHGRPEKEQTEKQRKPACQMGTRG